MSTINPHSLFHVWSPDEAAECLDYKPVSTPEGQELYKKLWELVEQIPEPNGFGDDFSRRCLAQPRLWNQLSIEQQIMLNDAATAEYLKVWNQPGELTPFEE